MNIAISHTNMDFDCLGSLILIKKLFPDYQLVRSSRILPAAQIMYDFYEGYFNFLSLKDISTEKIENIIIVDTCMSSRVSEYFSHIKNSNPSIHIFDHHPIENCDIPGAEVEGGRFGATTTILGRMAIKKKLKLSPEEATIALAAIYADTGRLLYDNVTSEDYEVSAWLLKMGASLRLVRSFLQTIKEDDQLALLNKLRPSLHTIHGNMILLSYMELVENVPGLSAVVEKTMESQNPDAYFAIFSIISDDIIMIIARSQRKNIDLNVLLSEYGGGGHPMAASAKISGSGGLMFLEDFRVFLEKSIAPAVSAGEIMTRNVFSILETTNLKDASMFLERVNLTAVPVVDQEGSLSGLISLRDIMKGRKHGKMHAPVKAYMSKPVISVGSNATMRDVEQIFYKNKISHLPILDEGKLTGIVTRWDYLQFQKQNTETL
ncbi:MAG: CBS domain-containing protein [Treponema sp.]|nr:CBS domain-containing protein [Treponema sp.]